MSIRVTSSKSLPSSKQPPQNGQKQSDSVSESPKLDEVRFGNTSQDKDKALRDLAADYGIELQSFHPDFPEPTPETLKGLLIEMGVAPNDLETTQGIERAQERFANTQWTQGLEPVLVKRQEDLLKSGLSVEVSLPETVGTEPIQWQLLAEDGHVTTGQLNLKNMNPHDSRVIEGKTYHRYLLSLEDLDKNDLKQGYYDLALQDPYTGKALTVSRLIITPSQTYLPENMGKVWGPTVQLYSLTSDPSKEPGYQGIGDFTTLKNFASWIRSCGGAYVGLNPLSTPNLVYPNVASPYSPTSRLFLNPLYVDVTAVPGYDKWKKTPEAEILLANPEYQKHLKLAVNSKWVQYDAVASIKLKTLEALFDFFTMTMKKTPQYSDFEKYCEKSGELLEQFAVFQTLQAQHRGKPWFHWPQKFQSPQNSTIAEVSAHPESNERKTFYQFLQWISELQLGQVNAQGAPSRLPLGLYLDLPVGAERGGFDTWRHQDLLAMNVSIGAPPDQLGPAGQNWGLPPFNPHKLRQVAYQPFIELIRASMRHAGILRIDHTLGLNRLFWILPNPKNPRDSRHGLYVKNKVEELLGIIALESHRNQCIVIGEDLGTVPEGLPEILKKWRLLSYKVGRWEKNYQQSGQPVKQPQEYQEDALATFSLHDSSTLAGMVTQWFWKTMAEQYNVHSPEMDRAKQDEADTLKKIIEVLQAKKMLNPGITLDSMRQSFSKHILNQNGMVASQPYTQFMLALQEYMGQVKSKLLAIQLEDILGMVKQVNIPGTSEAKHKVYKPKKGKARPYEIVKYPNWRQKMPLTVEQMMKDERFIQAFHAIERGRAQREAN